MSEAEIVGLVLTAALLSATAGIGLALVLHARVSSASSRRVRQMDAHADWLAARLSLTRISLDYVHALRALKASVRAAGAVALRRDEAHHARTAFHESTVRLDRAVSGLVVWSDEPDVFDRVRELERLSSEGLRAAIDGDDHGVEDFIRQVQEVDRQAVELVSRSTARTPRSRFKADHGVARLAAFLSSIVDHWAR